HRRQAPIGADLRVGETDGHAFAGRNRRQAFARAVIGVSRGVRAAVGDAVVVGRKVELHLRESIRGVVRVTHARLGRALTYRTDLGQIVAAVVEIGNLTGRVGDLREQRTGIGIRGGIAVGVARRDELAAGVVGFGYAGGAVGPGPLLRPGAVA